MENEPEIKQTLLQMFIAKMGDTFEEAKLAFYVTILASWGSLFICHWLKEQTALGPLLTGMWTGFAALLAKIGWAKNG